MIFSYDLLSTEKAKEKDNTHTEQTDEKQENKPKEKTLQKDDLNFFNSSKYNI